MDNIMKPISSPLAVIACRKGWRGLAGHLHYTMIALAGLAFT
jgi:hypothetical protein